MKGAILKSSIDFYSQWFYDSQELLSRFSKFDEFNTECDLLETLEKSWKLHLGKLNFFLRGDPTQPENERYYEIVKKLFVRHGAITGTCHICALWSADFSMCIKKWVPVTSGDSDANNRQEELILQCNTYATRLALIDSVCDLQKTWDRTPIKQPNELDTVSDYISQSIAHHRELLWDIVDIYVLRSVIDLRGAIDDSDRTQQDDAVRNAHAKAIASLIRLPETFRDAWIRKTKRAEELRLDLLRFRRKLARNPASTLSSFLATHNYKERAEQTIDFCRLWLEYQANESRNAGHAKKQIEADQPVFYAAEPSEHEVITVENANKEVKKLARKMKSEFWKLSLRRKAKLIGCHTETLKKTAIYQAYKKRYGANKDGPESKKAVPLPNDLAESASRAATLKELIASHDDDYEPSPLDIDEPRPVYSPKQA